MNGDTVLQLLTLLGGGAGIGSVITALFSRRKLSADTAKVLTDAASGVIRDLQEQIDDLKEWKREQVKLNREHRLWDADVVAHLKSAGITVPEPPTLNVEL